MDEQKLNVDISKDILRTVSDNAIDIVSHCGLTIRAVALLNVNAWQDIFNVVGK